jgi:hypothetical protein
MEGLILIWSQGWKDTFDFFTVLGRGAMAMLPSPPVQVPDTDFYLSSLSIFYCGQLEGNNGKWSPGKCSTVRTVIVANRIRFCLVSLVTSPSGSLEVKYSVQQFICKVSPWLSSYCGGGRAGPLGLNTQ